jgi:hypothetical protein
MKALQELVPNANKVSSSTAHTRCWDGNRLGFWLLGDAANKG